MVLGVGGVGGADCEVLIHDGEFKNMHNFNAFSLKLYFLYCMESCDCLAQIKIIVLICKKMVLILMVLFIYNSKKLNHLAETGAEIRRPI